MNAAKILREQRLQAADDRAHRIASTAAIELMHSEGQKQDSDTWVLPNCQIDDHMKDCIDHLAYKGEAAVFRDEKRGHTVVQLGNFTLGSLAAESL